MKPRSFLGAVAVLVLAGSSGCIAELGDVEPDDSTGCDEPSEACDADVPITPYAYVPPADSLRTLGANRNLRIGTAVKKFLLDSEPAYAEIVRSQFAYLTPSFEMKMQYTQPQRGVFDFSRADPIVAFASRYGQRVHGHTLVWHIQNPTWLTSGQFTVSEKTAILRAHVDTVVRHFDAEYPRRVIAWDVVNEAVNDNATPRQTVWSSIGYPSYIDIAFRAAHAADPDARLFYNDYLIEDITPKSTAVYNLVKGMKARGVPIHGVGMQAHMNTDNAVPTVTRLRENIRRFGALGLKVRYTELDVRTRTSDGTSTTEIERKRAFYRNLVRACRLESSTCIGVTFWGIDPEESWIPTTFPGYAARLLYNASYGKTEVYDIVAAELR